VLCGFVIFGLLAIVSIRDVKAESEDADSFKILNNSGKKITKVWVSNGGKSWTFDIGSGIANGDTKTLQWADWTDSLPCVLEFMCEFEDGTDSAEQPFDFCKKDLVLQFNPKKK